MTHLVQVYLPLADNNGARFDRRMFQEVEDRLTQQFDGFTSFSRSPAGGLWKSDTDEIIRDDIIVYEVLTDLLDRRWWREYRVRLVEAFRQERVLVRTYKVEIL